MYLRENLKSRPEFAKDLQEYKEVIKSFYRQEEEERKYLPGYAEYDAKQMQRMTHLEPFYYPVWDMEACEERFIKTAEAGNEPVYVLFDYLKRSPLTGEACVMPVG